MSKFTKNDVAHHARGLRWGVGLLCAVALTGCASMGDSRSPEDAVTQRSNDYWKARMAGEVAKTYAMATPGYRAVNSQEKFRLRYGAVPILKGGELVEVKCEEVRCEVRKSFTTSTPMMADTRIPIVLGEVWLKQDGQWWIFVE